MIFPWFLFPNYCSNRSLVSDRWMGCSCSGVFSCLKNKINLQVLCPFCAEWTLWGSDVEVGYCATLLLRASYSSLNALVLQQPSRDSLSVAMETERGSAYSLPYWFMEWLRIFKFLFSTHQGIPIPPAVSDNSWDVQDGGHFLNGR